MENMFHVKREYRRRSIELIALAKDIRQANARGEALRADG